MERTDIARIVVSSCCDEGPSDQAFGEFPQADVISCNHHLSHAYSAFCTSLLNEAVTLVLDAGGNTLDSPKNDRWWEVRREQQTYFLGSSSGLVKIGEDFAEPYAAGFGEIFRAFTYYLGWPSSRYAGNVMALAGHGDPDYFGDRKLFYIDEEGRAKSCVKNCPTEPFHMVESILRTLDFPSVERRLEGGTIQEVHRHLAAWVQRELEVALVEIVNRLIEETNVRDVCLAGGVAYNCKALAVVKERSKAKRVYVSPASGDQGQCLGNVLYGLATMDGFTRMPGRLSPYLGPHYSNESEELARFAEELNGEHELVSGHDLHLIVAGLLATGRIVGWYQGRSEFGPRALGNRSILASPSLVSVAARLNEMKGREAFMPFAPSVLAERSSAYFALDEEVPYMSMLADVREEVRDWISGVVNADGRSRVHTVSSFANSNFYWLIGQFEKLTGIPMVLNTSFNGRGEPIVETVEDAVRCYERLGLDALVVGDALILNDLAQEGWSGDIACKILSGSARRLHGKMLVEKLREQLEQVLLPRDRFLLYAQYYEWVKSGAKTTTIRYRKGVVDYPISTSLPLFITNDFSRTPRGEPEARLRVREYDVKEYGSLGDEDARHDGFESLNELLGALQEIYGVISPEELVTIYTVEIA
ncbi:MAG: ASCH domain-containing protein [Gammaproteobacteria bacterium]|nr:ASCH domain-containing protein [Gammaproteobacteria bacterium]